MKVLLVCVVLGVGLWLGGCGDDDAGGMNPTGTTGGTETPTARSSAAPTRPPTADPGPTATPSALCGESDATPFDSPDGTERCMVWQDWYSGEDGWRIKIFYDGAEVTDTFDLPANSVEFLFTPLLRPTRNGEECRLYRNYSVTVWAVFGEREQLVDGVATSLEGCPAVDGGLH